MFENSQNSELRGIIQGIIPQIQQIAHAYQEIGKAVSVLDEMNDKMKQNRNLVQSFLPDTVVQIAADTTANVGDYILVKSTKKLLDMADEKINWCTVDVREPVNEQIIKNVQSGKGTCNRWRRIISSGYK